MTVQRLFILNPAVIFTARVNQASFVYPLGNVTYDGVGVGAFGDIEAGMTILFGSTAGADDKGRQRVRSATSSLLLIGRSSQGTKDGEVDLDDNDYITVLNDFRVAAKIPAMDVTDDDNPIIYKDNNLVFTDQTDEIPPKANIAGGAAAGTINSGTSLLTVTFNGSASYAVADGATISSYSWDVGGGTITAGSGTNTITATFPAGFNWVSLTVTDSNTKTHLMRVPVYAFNPASPTTVPFQVVEHTITQEGQRCAFRILSDIPASTYPDGTLVIFWEGEPSSATDRTNVKFWGWHQSDSNNVAAGRTATLRDVVLNCVDVAGRLDTLPGFPQSVETHGTPLNWLEMKTPNMDKYLDYLFRWHSTALENAYYVPSGTGSNYPFVVLGSDGESLWNQVQRRAGAIVPGHRLTCNRNGEIKVLPDPILQEVADRTATSQVTINADDWTAVNWEYTRPPRVHWLRGEAILAHVSEIAAVFNNSPGVAPGQGESEQSSGEQLAKSQTDLNNETGHEYARLNAYNSFVSVSLPDDNDRIQPADMTWVTLDVSGAPAARRGYGFSNDRGLPIEVNISYEYSREGMVKRAELLWEQETVGIPAVTYIPPEVDWDPPWIPPPNPFPTPDPTPTGQGDGFGTFYNMTADVLGRTRDLSAASPAYVAIMTAGGSENLYDWILNPFDPRRDGVLISSDGVYLSEDLDLASPSFNLVLTTAEMYTLTGAAAGTLSNWFQIKGTIKKENFYIFGLKEAGEAATNRKVWVIVTNDAGATWNAYVVYDASGLPSSGTQIVYEGAIGVSDSELGPGGLPVVGICFGADSFTRFMISEDGGQTWTEQSSPAIGGGWAQDVHFPYNSNADSNKILVPSNNSGGSVGYFISEDRGVTFTVLSEAALLTKAAFNRTPFQSWTQNYQNLYAITGQTIYNSTDFGDTWTVGGAAGANIRAAGGFPYNGDQFYVQTTAAIKVSIDGGATWVDKTGDWAFGFATVTNCGGVVVPLWLPE